MLCLNTFNCADMGQFDATKGKQALEIRSSLSERRALTDPILADDSGDHAHSRQWAKAHGKPNLQFTHKYLPKSAVQSRIRLFVLVTPELPESMCLNFDCGAQIKLGFAAEFSNVLIIYTYIIKKPEDMSFCQAHVTDFTQVSASSRVHVTGKPKTFLPSSCSI